MSAKEDKVKNENENAQLAKENTKLKKYIEELQNKLELANKEIEVLESEINILESKQVEQKQVMLQIPNVLKNMDGTTIDRQAQLILEVQKVAT